MANRHGSRKHDTCRTNNIKSIRPDIVKKAHITMYIYRQCWGNNMSRPDYEDEMYEAQMEQAMREKQESCPNLCYPDDKWELDEDSIETGYIGGTEILMATLVCVGCGKRVHVEGVTHE